MTPGDPLTEKQQEFAETIEQSGRDLLNLIDEVLDLAKVESGSLRFEQEDIDITSSSVSWRGPSGLSPRTRGGLPCRGQRECSAGDHERLHGGETDREESRGECSEVHR